MTLPAETFRNIAEIPAHWARVQPKAPALIDGDVTTSYAELQWAVDWVSAQLRACGVQSGDRVIIVGENSLALVAFLLGTAAMGAWPMPINARMAPGEIEGLVDLVAPRLIVFTSGLSEEAGAHALRSGARVLQSPPVGSVVHVLQREPRVGPEPADAAARIAMLLPTSGTTGRPKAVMVSHVGLLNFCAVSVAERRLEPSDRIYAVLPMSHIFGVGTQLMASLYGGACLRVERRFTPQAWLDAIVRREVTMVFGVPTMYVRLMELVRAGGLAANPTPLRYAYVGAAALEPHLKQEFEARFGCPLQHGWGMTEYAGSMFITRADQPSGDGSAGYLNPGCEARFMDHGGREVEPGTVGEIWIRGRGLMSGYYRDRRLTAQAMRPGGWFNTGDLGRLDTGGALFLVGRSKDMIKRSGFNVYPAEVEAALNSHPAVLQSAVLGRQEPDGNEEVVAFLEPQVVGTLDEGELGRWLRERLSPYKVPSRWIMLTALPMLANGKIARQVLREKLAEIPA